MFTKGISGKWNGNRGRGRYRDRTPSPSGSGSTFGLLSPLGRFSPFRNRDRSPLAALRSPSAFIRGSHMSGFAHGIDFFRGKSQRVDYQSFTMISGSPKTPFDSHFLPL